MTVYSLFSPLALRDYKLREKETNAYTYHQFSTMKTNLEEEIRMLRSQMEMLVQEENSFTSDAVLQLSMALDEKINEYNKLVRNNKHING